MYMKTNKQTNKVIPKILNPFFTLVQQPDSFEWAPSTFILIICHNQRTRNKDTFSFEGQNVLWCIFKTKAAFYVHKIH